MLMRIKLGIIKAKLILIKVLNVEQSDDSKKSLDFCTEYSLGQKQFFSCPIKNQGRHVGTAFANNICFL